MNISLFLVACAGTITALVSWIGSDGSPSQARIPVASTVSYTFPTDTTDPASEAVVDTVATKAGENFVVEKSSGIDKRFEPVIKRLISDGWPKEWLEERFKDKRTVFIPKMAAVKPRSGSSSSGSAYSWVDTRESADACKEFITRHESIFAQAEQRYNVDRHTIAALMRCETRHGSVTGDYHVFSVYASMSLMGEKPFVGESIDRAQETLKARDMSKGAIATELDWIRNRAATRSKWAYKELVNLLKIDKSGHADAMSIYGSWAGAFGWSQFLPSSYLSRAVDGDGDDKIDLFNPADAINSVANYLQKAGYKKDNTASRKKALRNYNPSTPYVESIYALSERVRKDMGQ